MARKPGKAKIKAAMIQYAEWRRQVDPRISALANPKARAYITEWADEVGTRILGGELGMCTTALAASVRRDIESWESGYYRDIGPRGERICA